MINSTEIYAFGG
jgi:hypothetical protein